jgi:SAM-dependent methyltransferase
MGSAATKVRNRVRRGVVRAAGPVRRGVIRATESRPALASRTAEWTWLWQPGWSRRHHEEFYSGKVDPYGFDSNPGERRKYEETLALLDGRRFARALEVGAAEGAFTEMLVRHCDEVVATEVSEAAAARARTRLAAEPSVSVERRSLPLDAPEGTFDLIVCSDVLYLWQRETLDRGLELFARRLRPGGVLLLVHYVGDFGFNMSAHEVHDRAVAAAPGLGLEHTRSQELEHRGPGDAGYRADLLTRTTAGR